MTSRLFSLLALIALLSCSGAPDVSTTEDGGLELTDAGAVADGGVVPDAGADAGSVADAGADAGTELDGGTDAGTGLDAGTDAGTEADAGTLTDYGPVQCRVEADCPGLSSCNRNAPGGVCQGCGSINDCPSGTDCYTGTCVRDGCAVDSDCSAGMRCSTGTGRCLIRACPCANGYVCNAGTNLCERPSCASASCPAPFTCVDQVCVEP